MNDQEFAVVKKIAAQLAAKNYTGRLYEAGDLYAAGWIGVLEFHKQTNKSPMAIIVRRRMVDHIRLLRKRFETIVTNPVPFTDIEKDFMPFQKADNSFQENIAAQDTFEDIISVLPAEDRQIVRLYINDELTYAKIGKAIGVGESRVCRIFKERIFTVLEKAMTQ